LANRAQMHYIKPIAMGGGGESFVRLTPDAAGMAYLTTAPNNGNGTYSILNAGTATTVTLQGIGSHDADGDGMNDTATIQVWSDSLDLTVLSR
ncbi:MAG TPA: hypothetical protein VF398_07735, partial [bacterium]